MIKKINKAKILLERVSIICCIFSLGVLIVIVNIGVFYRYILNSPLTWTNELATYLLILFALWGATIGLLYGQFFCVEFIRKLLSIRGQLIFLRISKILILIFLIYAVFSTKPLIENARITQTLSPAMRVPMYLIYLSLAMGFLFMLFANLFSFPSNSLFSSIKINKNNKGRVN